MAELDTTNLNDLPNNENNITMTVEQPNSNIVESNTLNEVVSGIQEASRGGMLELPSRDIPQAPSNVQVDEKVNTNFIPKTEDYIGLQESKEEILEKERKEENQKNNIDFLFNELNSYVLMALVYFLFQLPFVNKYIYKYIPFCFHGDGNLNVQGILFKSILFSALIYLIDKSVENIVKL
jgi:hypothetical protein